MAIHNNSLISLQIQTLKCEQKVYFFKSKAQIQIGSFLIENNHCYHPDIMQKLKLIIQKKLDKITTKEMEEFNKVDQSKDSFGDKLAEDFIGELSQIQKVAENASVIELAEPFIGMDKCYDCISSESKCRRIILNSLNSDNQHDIELTIKTKSKELERLHIDEIVHFNVKALVNDIFLYMEPKILSNVVKIFLDAMEFSKA